MNIVFKFKNNNKNWLNGNNSYKILLYETKILLNKKSL